MPRITLPQFAGYLVTHGPPKVTKVLEARRADEAETYSASDFYIHLRSPLREALLAGGDPQPLTDVLTTLQDSRKIRNYREIVAGLTLFFASTNFEARPVAKRDWVHGDLTVSVTPTARLLIDGEWHVVYVHLKQDDLDARIAAPVLELIEMTHGSLGAPMMIDARSGRVFRPSSSPRTRRGLRALIQGEAEAFVRIWRDAQEVA